MLEWNFLEFISHYNFGLYLASPVGKKHFSQTGTRHEMMSVYSVIQKFKHNVAKLCLGRSAAGKGPKHSICGIQIWERKRYFLWLWPIKALKCALKIPLSPL